MRATRTLSDTPEKRSGIAAHRTTADPAMHKVSQKLRGRPGAIARHTYQAGRQTAAGA
ncbi:hypothetical protein Pme01_23850 [Planosporangium mesophilum]|uniref:Uncharacterized protein n=1 Tax=Planosporangium mesophilum TaxID=689768 RepID=A0A8J3X3E9_9ACTN|nr:hypothetical protein Pme01_23850 [Planosporangium mesophilum]